MKGGKDFSLTIHLQYLFKFKQQNFRFYDTPRVCVEKITSEMIELIINYKIHAQINLMQAQEKCVKF